MLSCGSTLTKRARARSTSEVTSLAPWRAGPAEHVEVELTTLIGTSLQGTLIAITDTTLVITPNLTGGHPQSETYDVLGRPRRVDLRNKKGEPTAIRRDKIRTFRMLQ
jgi:hypothetical protein